MLSTVKHKVRSYLKAFHKLDSDTQRKELQEVPGRLKLYERNAHGMDNLYQLSGLIYLRYLRRMSNEKTQEHKDRAHALLSASGAERWLNCPPSPRLEEGFPEAEIGYALEGTLAHELAELRLRRLTGRIESRPFFAAERKLKKSKYYHPDMDDYVQVYTDYVMQQFAEVRKFDKSAILLIEERINLTSFIEEGFGTGDVIIIGNKTLEVIDLKYGMGLRVDATENNQLSLYGAGAYDTYELMYQIDTINLTIVQPRMDSISTWSTDPDSLFNWINDVVKPGAKKAYAGEGEQKVGEWCQFCKAMPRCKAQQDLALKTAQEAFSDPELLTDEELVEVYLNSQLVEKWFKQVASYMFQKALDGDKWPGLKLVEGQSRRSWTDPEKAMATLSGNYKIEQYSNTVMKGIGDIEKLVGKKNFPIMFVDSVGHAKTSPSLVPESDKRPEMVEPDYFNDDVALDEIGQKQDDDDFLI